MIPEPFIIFPAIDLRQGRVVRLKTGDPDQLTWYSSDPVDTALRWLGQGAKWLHVVNLDGAFGEKNDRNLDVLKSIAREASLSGAKIQFGGGMRAYNDILAAFDLGIDRVVLGTVAVTNPALINRVLRQFDPYRIAVSIDARHNLVQLAGWQQPSSFTAIDLAQQMKSLGITHLIFTDIERDGMQTGANLTATADIAKATGLRVIASGGVKSHQDVIDARTSNLAGIIIGKALYEGKINLEKLLVDIRENLC